MHFCIRSERVFRTQAFRGPSRTIVLLLGSCLFTATAEGFRNRAFERRVPVVVINLGISTTPFGFQSVVAGRHQVLQAYRCIHRQASDVPLESQGQDFRQEALSRLPQSLQTTKAQAAFQSMFWEDNDSR